jgi:dienelactone hydrolase
MEFPMNHGAIKRFLIAAGLALTAIVFFFAAPASGRHDGVDGKEVQYSAGGVTLKGYIARDAHQSGKRPGVLVVHEWWGHNAYTRKRADMLAELGYVALAVDMYGDGKQADHPETAGKFAGEVMKNMPVMKQRFLAALDLLKKDPGVDAGRIAAIGYCFGGGVVLNMAREGTDLKGVVSFHGSLKASAPASKGGVKAEILVCNGADDPFVTKEELQSFDREMTGAQVKFKVVSYEGAVHAFTNPGATELGKKFNLPLAYNAKADEQSWSDMKSFLGRVLAR